MAKLLCRFTDVRKSMLQSGIFNVANMSLNVKIKLS